MSQTSPDGHRRDIGVVAELRAAPTPSGSRAAGSRPRAHRRARRRELGGHL